MNNNINGVQVVSYLQNYYKTTSIGLFVKVGSKNEPERLSGIVHFIEHMLLKRNTKYKYSNPLRIIEEIGGTINAFTTKEYICIHGKVLNRHYKLLLGLLLDLLLYPEFNNNDINIEKNVILNELWNYINNEEIQCRNKLMNAVLYPHPLSREILGTGDHINSFSRNDLLNFHNEIVKRNIVISIVGGGNNEEVLEFLEKKTSDLQLGSNTDINNFKLAPYNVINENSTNKKNINTISHAIPAVGFNDKNIVYFNFLATILRYGSGSILNKVLREEKGLVYYTHAAAYSYEDNGILLISCSSNKSKNISKIDQELRKIYQFIKNGNITIYQFNNIKEIVKSHIYFSTENPSNIMLEIGKRKLFNIQSVGFDYHEMDKINHIIDTLRYEKFVEFTNDIMSKKISTMSSICV
ncbi:MAG TPA: hypothetical protein DG757_09475 [Bacillus sp. (in: Bacteria)]|nr:hypothetical protein [Bacillus sp. (in: firmicutes)]